MLTSATANAAPRLSAENALGFFTNAASAMFQQQNLRDNDGNPVTVTNIPIWPTANNNFYTPAVHRILQLAANIFECTTSNLYPCIYRPRFTAHGTNIFISSYELVNGPDNEPTPIAFLSFPRDLNDPATRAAITNDTPMNIYGVPWVIGTKKGFPNLNQIAMQSVSQMSRRLMVSRPLVRSGWLGYRGKQMFVMGVSNSLAVAIWNSYNTAYPRPLYIQVDCKMTVQLTNNVGYAPPPVTFVLGGPGNGATNLPAGALASTSLQPPFTAAYKQPRPQSFVVPLQTNLVVLPDAVQIGGLMFAADNSTALWNLIPWDNLSDPHWGLTIANNLRCIVMDGGLGGRVVDYVQLSQLDAVRNLTQETLGQANKLDVWTRTTNTSIFWATPATPMSQGVIQQILISIGANPTSDRDWTDNGLPFGPKAASIANFFNFMVSPIVTSNFMQAPFTPTAKIRQMTKWQANDPLVHYLTEQLFDPDYVTNALVQPPNNTTFQKVTDGMFRLNDRFSPWGGHGPRTGWDPSYWPDYNLFNTTLKDPLVMVSDNWNFPSNQPLNFSWLGQVHRGTPWQTLYLKSADILSSDPLAWMRWSGSANGCLATNLAPINDWALASRLNSLLNTNEQRLSVNDLNTYAWIGLVGGLVVLTNDPAQLQLYSMTMSGHSSEAQTILSGITRTRLAQPSGYFPRVSDILATPELTDASPYLITNYVDGGGANLGLSSIYADGITDEALEKIPSQLLPLLRLDSVGAMIFANGPLVVQFTGDENYFYAVESSSNLVDWLRLSTNQPVNGIFSFPAPSPKVRQQFYRSVLLP